MIHWDSIGTVEGYGTTNTSTLYSYNYLECEEGVFYYRLKQIDFNGKSEISKVVSLNKESCLSYNFEVSVVVYPNPNSGRFLLSPFDENTILFIYDDKGHLIRFNKLFTSVGGVINILDGIPGVYFLHLFKEGKSYSSKFVLH